MLLCDVRTEMQLYIQERLPTGTTRRVPASDVYSALTSPMPANQLKTQLSVVNVLPKTAMNREQLKNYLATPPAG